MPHEKLDIVEGLVVKICKQFLGGLFALALIFISGPENEALAVPVTLSQFVGVVGADSGTGNPGTGVWQADLSGLGLGTIQSITIKDDNNGTEGEAGKLSGFDLDAITLSTTDCSNTTCFTSLSGLTAFNFSPSKTLFTAGTRRSTGNSLLFGELFGTASGETSIDNAVATLGIFDGTLLSDASGSGFASMGDGGALSFNLNAPIDTSSLFLYIGEVGSNGEAVSLSISASAFPVPEPGVLILLGSGLIGMFAFRRKLQNQV